MEKTRLYSLYLSKCPGEGKGLEELKEILEVCVWERKRQITDYPGKYPSKPFASDIQKTCNCDIDSNTGDFVADSEPNTLTPKGKSYKCCIEIEYIDNHQLVSKLKKYFKSKGTLVEVCKLK